MSGSWKIGADLATADLAHLFVGQIVDALAVEQDLPAGDPAWRLQQADDGGAGERLAGTGFPTTPAPRPAAMLNDTLSTAFSTPRRVGNSICRFFDFRTGCDIGRLPAKDGGEGTAVMQLRAAGIGIGCGCSIWLSSLGTTTACAGAPLVGLQPGTDFGVVDHQREIVRQRTRSLCSEPVRTHFSALKVNSRRSGR